MVAGQRSPEDQPQHERDYRETKDEGQQQKNCGYAADHARITYIERARNLPLPGKLMLGKAAL
jgi:hypothetical protein